MKNKEIVWLFLISLLIILSLYFDSEIIKFIVLMQNNVLNSFFGFIELIGSELVIFIFITLLFLLTTSKRKFVFPLWLTMFLSAGISFLIKISIQRPRPFQQGLVLAGLEKASHSLWNFSFPSFHAMFVFCILPLITKHFPKLKRMWIVLAVLVSFSRIYLGLHFLSDVLAGAMIGYLIGWFIMNWWE